MGGLVYITTLRSVSINLIMRCIISLTVVYLRSKDIRSLSIVSTFFSLFDFFHLLCFSVMVLDSRQFSNPINNLQS